MRRYRFALAVTLTVLVAVSLAMGCGKGKKSTNPAVGALELNSGNIAAGNTYAHRFFAAGAYPYHCSIHSSMTGIVVVTASAPASDSLMIVDIPGFSFSPTSVTIPVGGKVTWTNSAGMTHTVTSD